MNLYSNQLLEDYLIECEMEFNRKTDEVFEVKPVMGGVEVIVERIHYDTERTKYSLDVSYLDMLNYIYLKQIETEID